jgi:hypothetical protein
MDVDSWESIERNALWALEHAADLSPREPVSGTAPLLRVWAYRSNGTFSSWTVLSSAGTSDLGRPTVREVVWNRDQDERHLASAQGKNKLRTKPQSTIRVRDAQILSEDFGPFLEAAARLTVPARAAQDPDSQEDSFGIEGYRSLAYLRVEWRGSGPVEWAETIGWVVRLRKLLAASLQEREASQG